jgi:hypothetical protein
MSKVEELEQVIENLPPEDFEQLSAWMARHRAILPKSGVEGPMTFRDHGAFLNGYSAEDEGLYDDAQGR